MRIRGTSVEEMEEEGLETDGVVESSSKLQSKIKSLSGVDILTDTGAYKSTYQILSDIAEVWEDMNDMDQAALLELLAGKRAGSVMSAILQNPETLKDAFESANEATGSAITENEKYMESIQGHMDQFTNSLQTMWNDELNGGMIKWFVHLGKVLIEVIDLLGLFGTTFVVISAIIMIKNKMNLAEYFTSIGTSLAGLNVKLEGFLTRLGIIKTTSQATQASMRGLTVGMIEQKLAVAGVSTENQKLILSKMGLDAANKSQVLSSKLVAASALGEAVANKTLNEIQAFSIARKLGLITVTKSLNGATTLRIAKIVGLTNAETISLGKTLGVIGATKVLTKEEIKNTVAKLGLTDATKAQRLENLLLLASQGKLSASFKLLTYSIKDFYTKNKTLISLAAAAAAIYAVVAITKALITTLEEQEEKLTELNTVLESTESKLSDLESQLKEVKDRIDELNNQESLTFVEQEELDTLRAQSEELERQISLNEQIRDAQQKKVNEQALTTAQQYENANFETGKGKEETQQGWATGTAIGLGVAGVVVSAILTGGLSLIPALIGALAGGLAGAGVGYGIGTGVAEGSDQVGESMDKMLEERKKLEEEYKQAQAAYVNDASDSNKEDYEEAEEALTEYDSMMAEHINKLDSYYSQIDLSAYDPILDKQKIEDVRKKLNEFYDTQDKWAIANGDADAKNNAITRIFGENASQELKNIKREIKAAAEEAVKTAEETGTELNFDVDLSEYMNPADLDAFTARLHDMGINVYEVENYFKDMAVAEKEAAEVSLYGVVTDINNITEGLENLKDAFDEVLEGGFVTAKTLTELNEVFGDLGDSWDNYVSAMFSGVSSTKEMQEATEELAKAFIDSKILTGEAISEYERMSYIIQLRNMGVMNAEEYVDDKIQENAYKMIENSATYNKDEILDKWIKASDDDKQKYKNELGITKTDFYELSSEELEKLAEHYDLSREINAETAQKIADEYGIEAENLEEVVGLLQKQIGLKEDLVKLNEKQEQAKVIQDELNAIEEVESVRKNMADKYGEGIQKLYIEPNLEYEYSAEYAWNEMIDDDVDTSKFNKSTFIQDYNRLKTLYDHNGSYEDLLKRKKELEEELKNLNIDPANNQKQIDDLNSQIDDITNQIETEYTLDIELNFELQKKSDLVDQLQEVYDSLADAEKEYNENGGYVSVDTLQSLLELEPKYLSMLYDENGQLNLNKQTILQVAQARTLDMGIQAAQNVITQASEALEANKIDRLRELTEVTYDQADANWTLVESNLAALKSEIEKRNADPTNAMYGQLGGVYDGIASQVYAIRDLTNKSVANIANSFSSSGNTAKEDASDAFQKAMEYWENRIGANQARYEQVQNEIDLLEKKGKMAGEGYYQEQIKLENQRLKLLESQKAEAQKFLRTFKEGSDEWWEAANTLNDIEGEIDDVTSSIQDLNDAMDQIHWDIFDKTHERFGNLASQLQTIRDLLSADEDSFFNDEGEWTETGVAVLGTYIQELEIYENALKKTQEEIKNLNINDFDSEQEFYD